MNTRHMGEMHLADAAYFPEKKILCLYFVGASDSSMVIGYVPCRDPQAFLHGFLGGKRTQTAYDYSGYKIPINAN